MGGGLERLERSDSNIDPNLITNGLLLVASPPPLLLRYAPLPFPAKLRIVSKTLEEMKDLQASFKQKKDQYESTLITLMHRQQQGEMVGAKRQQKHYTTFPHN